MRPPFSLRIASQQVMIFALKYSPEQVLAREEFVERCCPVACVNLCKQG